MRKEGAAPASLSACPYRMFQILTTVLASVRQCDGAQRVAGIRGVRSIKAAEQPWTKYWKPIIVPEWDPLDQKLGSLSMNKIAALAILAECATGEFVSANADVVPVSSTIQAAVDSAKPGDGR